MLWILFSEDVNDRSSKPLVPMDVTDVEYFLGASSADLTWFGRIDVCVVGLTEI
jgi:hypothetical protein